MLSNLFSLRRRFSSSRTSAKPSPRRHRRKHTREICTNWVEQLERRLALAPVVSSWGVAATDSSSVTYSVQFNESVSGVAAADFAVSTTPNLTQSGGLLVTGSGSSYQVKIPGLDGTGEVFIMLSPDATISGSSGSVGPSLGYSVSNIFSLSSADISQPFGSSLKTAKYGGTTYLYATADDAANGSFDGSLFESSSANLMSKTVLDTGRDDITNYYIYAGDGSGRLVGLRPMRMRSHDMNRDGRPDLIRSYYDTDSGYLDVWLRNSDGTLSKAASIRTMIDRHGSRDQTGTSREPLDFNVGDFDNDGDADIVVLYAENPASSGIENGQDVAELHIYLNDGSGGFPSTPSQVRPISEFKISAVPMNAAGIIVGNFDGTGGDDIVVPGSTGGQKVTIGGATYVYNNSIWRFSSTGSGSFSTPSRVGPAFSAPEGIVQVASYNGNGSGVDEIYFSTVSDFGASSPSMTTINVYEYTRQQNGTWIETKTFDVSDQSAANIHFENVIGSNDKDLVITSRFDTHSKMAVYQGHGTGFFDAPHVTSNMGVYLTTDSFDFADVDSNGKVELYASGFGTNVSSAQRIQFTTNGSAASTYIGTFTQNNAPTNILLSNDSYVEGSTSGHVIGQFSTTDADLGDTHTYALVPGTGSSTNVEFDIVGNKLVVQTPLTPSGGPYSIRVRSTDNSGGSTEKAFQITVTPEGDIPPTDITLALLTSLFENMPVSNSSGWNGLFSTTDASITDSHTYTLVSGIGNDDNDAFEIFGGELWPTRSFNYEAENTVSIRVRSTDSSNLFIEKAFTLEVTDVNEAPTALTLTNKIESLPENTSTATPTRVADIVITDDALGTETNSLTGADNASFEIIGNSLYLKAGISLEAASKPTFNVTVQAVDTSIPGSGVVEDSLNLTITEVNEPPSSIAFNPGAMTSIEENTDTNVTPAIAIGTVTITDDAVGNNVVQITGPDAASFTYDPDTETVSLRKDVDLDYETKQSYVFTVQASDPGIIGLPLPHVSFSHTLNVTDVNEPPDGITLIGTGRVNENSPIGTTVGGLVVNDPDGGGGTFTYTFVNGTGSQDNTKFSLSGSNILTGSEIDHESQNSFSIRVRAADQSDPSLFIDRTFTISSNDINEAPTAVQLQNTTLSLNENTNIPVRRKLADVVISDDAPGNNSITLTGPDAASFEVDPTGLFLRQGTKLNFENQNRYDVTVNVADGTLPGSTPVTTPFRFDVLDVNERPQLSLGNPVASIDENTDTTTRIPIASLDWTDDALGSHVFSLSGIAANDFEIDADTLYLKANTVLDFETLTEYPVAVTIADPTLPSNTNITRAHTLDVIDVNEHPKVLTFSNEIPVDEYQTIGTRLPIANLSVDDVLGRNVYSVEGPNADYFVTDGADLYLKKGSEIDYEVMSPFKVTVAVVDESLSPEQKLTREFQLVINNKDESTLFPPKADIGETLLTVDPRGNAYADGELIRINGEPTSKTPAIGELDQGAPWEFLDAEIQTLTDTRFVYLKYHARTMHTLSSKGDWSYDIFEDIQNTRKGRLSRTRDVPEKTSNPEPVALVPLVASSDVTLTKNTKGFLFVEASPLRISGDAIPDNIILNYQITAIRQTDRIREVLFLSGESSARVWYFNETWEFEASSQITKPGTHAYDSLEQRFNRDIDRDGSIGGGAI